MSKKGMIKVILVAEVKDKAKAKERLPGMIDNARKFPGVANFDFCEVVINSIVLGKRRKLQFLMCLYNRRSARTASTP